MPIYDYKCETCGKVSEFLLGSVDGVPGACPECGGDDMTRLMSASYAIRMGAASTPGTTCCGREERCETPACATGRSCRREG